MNIINNSVSEPVHCLPIAIKRAVPCQKLCRNIQEALIDTYQGWRVATWSERSKALFHGTKVFIISSIAIPMAIIRIVSLTVVVSWLFRLVFAISPYIENLATTSGLYCLKKVWENPPLQTAAIGLACIPVALAVAIPTLTVAMEIKRRLSGVWYKRQQEKLAPNQNACDAVLIVKSRLDHNGAIETPSVRELATWRDLTQKYSLHVENVSSIEEINQAIEKVISQGKQIKLLWMNIHGSPKGVLLDARKMTMGSELRQIQFSKLTPDATIFLASCSTGGQAYPKKRAALNVAEWVKLAAGKGRRVFAPKIDMDYQSYKLLDVDHRLFAIYGTSASNFLITGEITDWNSSITVEPNYSATRKKLDKMMQAIVNKRAKAKAAKRNNILSRIRKWFG